MGPKKKGKGSKLARMSEEERMRYLQHRAAIEEEARRRKEQLIATFMKVSQHKLQVFRKDWKNTLTVFLFCRTNLNEKKLFPDLIWPKLTSNGDKL